MLSATCTRLHHLSAVAAVSRLPLARASSTAAVQWQQKPQYERPTIYQPTITTPKPAITRRTPMPITRRPPSAELPAPSFIDIDYKCRIEYIDVPSVTPVNATDASTALAPTLVLIHGAPGTYSDFRYLIPLLSTRGVRVIGVNLPGFGGSQVFDRENYYDRMSMHESVQLTHQAVQRILDSSPHGNVFVLGHSFGGHAAVHLTKLAGNHVKGLALLSSAGHRHHRVIWPGGNSFMLWLLRSKVPMLENMARFIIAQVYIKLFKFQSHGLPIDHFSAGLVYSATADFQRFAEHLEHVSVLPNFVAWAKDDTFVQKEITEDVSRECRPGPRIVFDKGGHNIQKTQAPVLAKALAEWMRSVADGSYEATYGDARTRLRSSEEGKH